MSGILGIYRLNDRSVDPTDLTRMVDTLAHRGPDGSGTWHEGPVGLGHLMLWTTPESLHEHLPLLNARGDLIITADARIDNRDELITTLGLTDGLRSTSTDTLTDSELILRAYEKWDDRCPEHLLGDFTFAIWDQRKQQLFCARDHMGVKPFYYYRSDKLFAFASEIKALLSLPEVPRRLNEERIGDFLLGMFEDREITFYEDIRRLPAAHTLEIRPDFDDVQPRLYWSLDPAREVTFSSDEEYAAAFRELFIQAVRCRLRSASPVGVLLSGGLDSSSVTCVARHILTQEEHKRKMVNGAPLHTFSAIFDDVPECDERLFINAVLAQGDLEPHYMHADRISLLAELDCAFWHTDEVYYVPNRFWHWPLYRAAREAGVRILLSGQDGDTVVSHGGGLLVELTLAGRWATLAREVKEISTQLERSPFKVLWRYVVTPLVMLPLALVVRRILPRRLRQKLTAQIIKPEFARNVRRVERSKISQDLRSIMEEWTSRGEHYLGLTSGLEQYILEAIDHEAAAHRVECRYPFFDRRLMEFCLALPPEQKLHHGFSRAVMRRAMNTIVPATVQWRGGKTNLTPNFIRALTFEREQLEEVILHNSQEIEAFVNMSALRSAYHRFMSKCHYRDAMRVWEGVMLALWLRYVDLTLSDEANQRKEQT